MDTRSILLAVKDPQLLVDITQALGADWNVASSASEADALGNLEKRSFDAVLVDFNLLTPDASELLNQVYEKHPESVRFLLAYEADLALVAAKVEGSPLILPKPIDPVALKNRIESEVKEEIFEPSASAPKPEPPAPSFYSDVLKALAAPGITIQQAGEIIAPHTVLVVELFKLTNSSYLGLPSDITDPAEAVETLGIETVKAVVMVLQFLEESSRLKSAYLSPDKIWEHSVTVGQIARDLVLFETKDRALASQALTAGLLHDLGKLVLAKNFEDLYGRVHSLARKQPVALWEIEKEMFGADHGEIGGCLVGMWNMPLPIVDAAALHHQPPLGDDTQLTPLAAVHVANVLANELSPDEEQMMVAPIISTPFLNQLGLLHRLPLWHARFGNRRSASLQSGQANIDSNDTERSGSTMAGLTSQSQTANHFSAPVRLTRTGSSRQSDKGEEAADARSVHHRNNWILFAAAAAMVLVVLSFMLQSDPPKPELAYARSVSPQAASTEPSNAWLKPQVQDDSAADRATPAQAAVSKPDDAPDERPTPQEANVSKASSVPSTPTAPAPVAAVAPSAIPTNVPAPTLAMPEHKAQPQFRLSGIIYTPASPSAIVNGVTVHIGDSIDGATVVSITPKRVNLQIDGERKTLDLR